MKQLQINITVSQWLIVSLQREKRITLKVGNALVTKITDFVLGLIVLYLFFKHEQEILVVIRDITEVSCLLFCFIYYLFICFFLDNNSRN